MGNRGDRNLSVLVRLRPGVTVERAQAALTVVSQRLSQQYPWRCTTSNECHPCWARSSSGDATQDWSLP
jgi:hypothetical protein